MATLQWSHPIKNSLLLFVCCRQKDLAQMPFSLRCVQYMVTSVLRDQQYMFGLKSFLMVEKVLLTRKNLLFRRPMQRTQRSILSCGQTGVWWDKCLHEIGRYVEKWNINVWRDVCLFFTFLVGLTHSVLQHLQVAKENCWAKNCTDWLRSKYKWRHGNDVIVIKKFQYVCQIKFPTKRIFPNFHILKINRITSFW